MAFLPDPQHPQEQEQKFLSHQPATTSDLNQYRFGGYHHDHANHAYPIAVPHPQNQHYSSIHTAQRKQKDNEWWQRKKVQLHHEDINHQHWIRPMQEHEFQVHRPNIHTWNRVFKMRFPEW